MGSSNRLDADSASVVRTHSLIPPRRLDKNQCIRIVFSSARKHSMAAESRMLRETTAEKLMADLNSEMKQALQEVNEQLQRI